MLGLSILVAGALAGAETVAGPAVEDLSVDYRLLYAPEPAPGRWEIEVEVTDTRRRARPVELWLNDWGEWTEQDGYLSDLSAEPELARDDDPQRFTFRRARGRKRVHRLRYAIALNEHGSERHRAHGLLPCRLQDVSFGYAVNTLPRLDVQDGDGPVRRRVVLEAPEGMAIASGWGGRARGRQELELGDDPDQCLIFFGEPRAFLAGESGGVALEVFQYGSGTSDVTPVIFEGVSRLAPGYESTTGRALGKPLRVFVQGVESGGGGVRTDHGLGLGYNENPGSPYYQQTIAHELFHEWLPGKLGADGPSLVWFFEGFTDYLALWHLARTEVVELDWFAQRLLEIERDAKGSGAWGAVNFGDPETEWRDRDGPHETMAYKGGALVAFHLDVALCREGLPAIVTLIADLLEEGEGYSLDRIRQWLEGHGLEDWYDTYLTEATELPDAGEALRSVGFLRVDAEVDAMVTWFGIETSDGERGGEVLAIHPEGPTATRELRVGDVILRGGPPRATEARPVSARQYDFGLTTFSQSWPDQGWWVEVERGGETLRVAIEPWLQPGAVETVEVADPEVARELLSLRR